MRTLSVFTCVKNVRDQTRQAFVTRFCPFVTARASLFTDHKMSGLPIRARYRQFRTICEQIVDNSPTDFFFFEIDGHPFMSRFIWKFAISFHTFLGMTLHIVGPRRCDFCIRYPCSSGRKFFKGSSRNPGFKHISVSSGPTGSSLPDNDRGHLCCGKRIRMSGHSDFGIFNNFSASSIFSRVKADTASVA